MLFCLRQIINKNRLLLPLFISDLKLFTSRLSSNRIDSNMSVSDESTSLLPPCPTLKEVVNALKKLAPPNLAEVWDNVGLLVEPSSPDNVNRIMLTIDLTEAVLHEAILNSAQLIISYHPPIFRPLKALRASTHWKERIVVKCIENNIAVYSPHTALDAVKGGINDWLLSPFPLKECWPLQQRYTQSGTLYDLEANFNSDLNPDLDALKDFGEIDIIDKTVRVTCAQNELSRAFEVLHFATKSNIKVTKLESHPILGTGMGRGARLLKPLPLGDVIEKVKHLVGKDKIRVAYAHKKEDEISTVAVCAGSGGSVLGGQRLDLFITGEMSHHEVLEAVHQNKTTVILCEHTNTERGYLEKLRDDLREVLKTKTIDIFTSKADDDPLRIV